MTPSSLGRTRSASGATPTRAAGGRAWGAGVRGLTLLEIVIAVALGAVVVGLVGSLLVAGLNIWRRGRDLQEAQAHAAVLVDAVARDVRNASQTPGVIVQPRVPVDDGEPVLAVMPAAGPEASGEWIVYVFRRGRGEVLRQRYTADAQGRMVQQGSRMVATGVVGFTVEPADGGVTVEVEVRRGRVRGQARTTAAPRNP